ncbi:MAG: diaminopimelate decarboxylase, partial [Streptosporangiales bacterium]|nr:diaminopimelate decarboxylase [Streptosporangiales bacterium]
MSRAVHPAGPLHADMLPEGAVGPAPDDLNALTPTVWSTTAERSGGAVRVGGVDLRHIAREFGTPVYVLDEADFRARAHAHREAFQGFDVYYAAKAFFCSPVARWLAEDGLSLDVCSLGELVTARRA